MARLALLFLLATACAADASHAWEPRRGPVYKPGQSLSESRICTCEDCIDRGCCSGEPGGVEYAELDLGMTLAGCGRCVRRVWTVRGAGECAALAGPECCPGTVSN